LELRRGARPDTPKNAAPLELFLTINIEILWWTGGTANQNTSFTTDPQYFQTSENYEYKKHWVARIHGSEIKTGRTNAISFVQ
jgi:hypothetical protein